MEHQRQDDTDGEAERTTHERHNTIESREDDGDDDEDDNDKDSYNDSEDATCVARESCQSWGIGYRKRV